MGMQHSPTKRDCSQAQPFVGIGTAMKYSLRKTPSHLHLIYKYGDATGGLLGRNTTLEVEGSLFTLEIDLGSNLITRNKSSSWYRDAVELADNYHKLKSLQCADNLVRTRLIRAWESVAQPQMRMRLKLGERGDFLYDVSPHSLFTGGIQLDVREFLPQQEQASEAQADLQHKDHA